MPSDIYAHIAPYYDSISQRFLSAPRRRTADLCRTLGARRVLDIGCGTGLQCRELARRGLLPVGLDASAAMLAKARRNLGDAVPLVRAPLLEAPFKQGSFDAAICSLLLHENAAQAEAMLQSAFKLAPLVFVMEWRLVERNLDYLTGAFTRPLIHLVERMAGLEHYAGFIEFKKRGGAYALCRNLHVAHEESLRAGSLLLLALRQ